MKLTFITGNKGKFEEASKIIVYLEQKDIDLVEIQSLDPKEIIKAKLEEAKKHIDGNIIVEDGSLCLESLNGLPGPFAKWFWNKIGNEGFYKLALGTGNLNVTTKVVVGLSILDEEIKFFEGEIKGKLVAPRGDNGFGFDPIFEVEGTGKTFAEMTMEEKNEISMRKIAFQKLKDYLEKK